jgi:hypothetical protein
MAGEIRTVPGTRLLSVSRAVLTGDAVLGRNDATYQFFDAGAANRNVTLPAAEKWLAFVVKNFGAANNIVVKDAAATVLATLTQADPVCTVIYDGTEWQVL